jgi:hypothetical protein
MKSEPSLTNDDRREASPVRLSKGRLEVVIFFKKIFFHSHFRNLMNILIKKKPS